MSDAKTVLFIILYIFSGSAVLMTIFWVLTKCGITPQQILEKFNRPGSPDKLPADKEQPRQGILSRRAFIIAAAVLIGLLATAAAGSIRGNITDRQRELEQQNLVTTTTADLGIRTAATRHKQYIIDVPYVGMPESRIYGTALGAPDAEIRHNNEMIGGLQYTANLYDFKVDGWTIFTARCVNGVVTDVWDDREHPVMWTKHTAPPPGTYGDDEFDVYDYYMPEDFYEDHYDDFYDYYEAEEYFYEHQ